MRRPKPSAPTVFVLLMAISLLSLFVPPVWLRGFRAALNSLLTPPAVGANRVLHYFAGTERSVPPEDTTDNAELRRQLRYLTGQARFLHVRLMDLAETYAKAEHLRNSLLLYDYSLVPANVSGYGLPGQAGLSIDQGSTAGLEIGFWVVGFIQNSSDVRGRALLESSLLVGQIVRVQPRTAQVRLLGDSGQRPLRAQLYRYPSGSTEAKPAWQSPDLHLTQLASGRLMAKYVPKEDLAADENLTDVVGAYVVSGGMNTLPAGLTLGRVVKVEDSPRGMLFSDLIIEPSIGKARLSSVMVLKPNKPDG